MHSRDCGDEFAPWIAIVVRPRAERKVQTGLVRVGLDTFVPWHKVRHRWSDRIKTLERNLFPGYVFCRSTFAHRRLVMDQPGVEGVVTFDHRPALIPDGEIVALKRTLESGLPLGPWPFLKIGQRVRIQRGVLEGIEGALAWDSGTAHIVVSVGVLARSIAVQVDRDAIRPISCSVSNGRSQTADWIHHLPTHAAGDNPATQQEAGPQLKESLWQ